MDDDNVTTWTIEREKGSRLFGGTMPSNVDDEAIANVFANHPAAVIAEIAQLATAYDNGRVHSPWKALAAKLAKITTDGATVNVGQDVRIRQAEAWIRNAGIYCPNEAEVLDELFGENSGTSRRKGGLLLGLEERFADRMLALWRTEKPRADTAEREMLERAARNTPA